MILTSLLLSTPILETRFLLWGVLGISLLWMFTVPVVLYVSLRKREIRKQTKVRTRILSSESEQESEPKSGDKTAESKTPEPPVSQSRSVSQPGSPVTEPELKITERPGKSESITRKSAVAANRTSSSGQTIVFSSAPDNHELFTRQKNIFDLQLRRHVRQQLRPDLFFIPGIDGMPAMNRNRSVFLKSAVMNDNEICLQADSLMPLLYHHFVRAEMSSLDPVSYHPILVPVVNYAIWRGRNEWIYNLASRLLSSKIHSDEVFYAAALIGASESKTALTDYYSRIIINRNERSECALHLLSGGENQVENLENYRGLYAKSEDFDAAEKFDIFAAAGHIFRAIRQNRTDDGRSDFLLRAYLRLALMNGKFYSFIKLTSQLETPLSLEDCRNAVYCIFRSAPEQALELVQEFCRKHNQFRDEILAFEQKAAMIMERGSSGSPELLRHDHESRLLNLLAVHADSDRSIGSWSKIFKYIAENNDTDFLEMAMRDYFLYCYQNESYSIDDSFIPSLSALSGPNLFFRGFMGMYESEKNPDRALASLIRCGTKYPRLLHTLAELSRIKGINDISEKSYALIVRKFPAESVFWYNYGVILEGGGHLTEALHAFKEAVYLDPGILDAREAISRLIMLVPSL